MSVSDARLELLLETLELRLDILVAAPAAPALSGLACVKRQWQCQARYQAIAASNLGPGAPLPTPPSRTRLLEKAVKLQSNPYCGVAEVGLAL